MQLGATLAPLVMVAEPSPISAVGTFMSPISRSTINTLPYLSLACSAREVQLALWRSHSQLAQVLDSLDKLNVIEGFGRSYTSSLSASSTFSQNANIISAISTNANALMVQLATSIGLYEFVSQKVAFYNRNFLMSAAGTGSSSDQRVNVRAQIGGGQNSSNLQDDVIQKGNSALADFFRILHVANNAGPGSAVLDNSKPNAKRLSSAGVLASSFASPERPDKSVSLTHVSRLPCLSVLSLADTSTLYRLLQIKRTLMILNERKSKISNLESGSGILKDAAGNEIAEDYSRFISLVARTRVFMANGDFYPSTERALPAAMKENFLRTLRETAENVGEELRKHNQNNQNNQIQLGNENQNPQNPQLGIGAEVVPIKGPQNFLGVQEEMVEEVVQKKREMLMLQWVCALHELLSLWTENENAIFENENPPPNGDNANSGSSGSLGDPTPMEIDEMDGEKLLEEEQMEGSSSRSAAAEGGEGGQEEQYNKELLHPKLHFPLYAYLEYLGFEDFPSDEMEVRHAIECFFWLLRELPMGKMQL